MWMNGLEKPNSYFKRNKEEQWTNEKRNNQRKKKMKQEINKARKKDIKRETNKQSKKEIIKLLHKSYYTVSHKNKKSLLYYKKSEVCTYTYLNL